MFTIAPVGVGREQLYAFESGGFLPANPDPSRVTHLADGSTMAPIESLFEEEFTRLRDQLSRIPNLVCVVVDPLPRRGDPCLHGYAETIFYAGDDVYHVIRSATSEAAAERALSASPPWSSLNVLSTIAPTLDDNRHTELSELRKCAGAVVEMSCGAYDGEGYVNWRRG
ncbi:MAG TPA: hypothetical protein VEA63_13745 [Opitutus sp.]|nr:hypothetical protein [Opitutus sp.]